MTDRELLDDLLNGCVMAKGQGKRSDNTAILEEMIEIIRTRLTQPELEPVAWLDPYGGLISAKAMQFAAGIDIARHTIPLYSAPPKKEWVGLTDEEVKQLSDYCVDVRDEIEFIRAIEEEIKEKNNG